MTARSMAQLLADLGVERSHSRPRVSNDNPFSEAQFKTLKYCPQFPGSFAGYEAAKTWCESFFAWYNHEHRHEGIGLFSPADVYSGRHLELTRARQRVLDQAYLANPEPSSAVDRNHRSFRMKSGSIVQPTACCR